MQFCNVLLLDIIPSSPINIIIYLFVFVYFFCYNFYSVLFRM